MKFPRLPKGGDPQLLPRTPEMIVPMKPMAFPWDDTSDGWLIGSFVLAWSSTNPTSPTPPAPRHGAFWASTTRLEGSAIDAQQYGISAGLVGGCWEVGLVVDQKQPQNNPQKRTGKGERPGFLLGVWFGIFFFLGYGPWMVFENCWLDRFRNFLGLKNKMDYWCLFMSISLGRSLWNLRCWTKSPASWRVRCWWINMDTWAWTASSDGGSYAFILLFRPCANMNTTTWKWPRSIIELSLHLGPTNAWSHLLSRYMRYFKKELVAQVNFGFMGKWYRKDIFERPWKHHNKIDIIYHE